MMIDGLWHKSNRNILNHYWSYGTFWTVITGPNRLKWLAQINPKYPFATKLYIDDLINYCSDILTDHYGKETTVSRRQIFIDIDFMRSDAGFEAPIIAVKDGRKVYYKYADPSFSILKK